MIVAANLDWIDPYHGFEGRNNRTIFDPSTWSIVHENPYPQDEAAIDREEFNRETIHEITHWLQYSATTWGIFTSICNMGQSQRVAKWLDSVSDQCRDRFLTAHQEDKTIFSIAENKELVANMPEIVQEQTSTLGEFIALYYGSQLLRDAQSLRESRAQTRLLSQTLEVSSRFPWRDHQIEYTPSERSERLGDNVSYDQLDVGCSTIDLLESLAVASEFLSTGHAYEGDFNSPEFEMSARLVAGRLLGVQYPQYSTCFRIWVGRHPLLRVIGSEDPQMENLGRAAFTFSLLADAALNPPLPPLYKFTSFEDVLWKDIFPPARFSLLVDAASTMNLIDVESSDSDAQSWIIHALERAGLPGLHRNIGALRTLNDVFQYDFPDDFAYIEATLLPRFKKLLNLRKKQLLTVVLPGEVVNRTADYFSIEAEEARQNAYWLPFFFDDNLEIKTFMPSEACARYCESAFLRRCLRFAPILTLGSLNKRPHHARLAEHRPRPPQFAEDSLSCIGRQYGAWS